MANAAAQTGYLSKAYRGATKIEHVQSFELPDPSTNLIPMPELEQTNNVVPKIGGSTELGEMTITCVRDKTSAIQNALEATFLSGDKTPEAFSVADCDPVTGVADFTYACLGFLTSVKTGPYSTSEGKLMVIKIALTSAITRTP